MRLIAWAMGWLIGIGVGELLDVPWTAAATAAAAAFLLAWRNPRLREGLLLVAFLSLGLLRSSLAPDPCGGEPLTPWAGGHVVLRGTAIDEPEPWENGSRFPMRVEAVRQEDGTWHPVRSVVLVGGPALYDVSYGSRLTLKGELARQAPKSGGSAPYCLGLRKGAILERFSEPGGSTPARLLHFTRTWARKRLQALFPEPQASLLVGILLGSRTALPQDVTEAFSRSGTSHILAISGWNITLVVGLLGGLTRLLPRRLALPVVLAGIGAYTLLVGAGAAVVRAALMGSLYLFARQLGRPADALTALFASAWMMTLWDPHLMADIGFQLSCSATLGMLLFVPVWSDVLQRWPSWLKESLAATLASQLLTWPMVALHFRTYSLVVPLANLLACPALAPLMLLGTLALFLGQVPLVGPLVCGAGWVFGGYMLGIVRWTGSLSWAALRLPVLGVPFLLGYYGALGFWWYLWKASEAPCGCGQPGSA